MAARNSGSKKGKVHKGRQAWEEVRGRMEAGLCFKAKLGGRSVAPANASARGRVPSRHSANNTNVDPSRVVPFLDLASQKGMSFIDTKYVGSRLHRAPVNEGNRLVNYLKCVDMDSLLVTLYNAGARSHHGTTMYEASRVASRMKMLGLLRAQVPKEPTSFRISGSGIGMDTRLLACICQKNRKTELLQPGG